MPWRVDVLYSALLKKGAAKLLGGRDEHPLKVSVGGKTQEPPHSCRICQSPWKSSINPAPTHVTVAEPRRTRSKNRSPQRELLTVLCVLLQALDQAGREEQVCHGALRAFLRPGPDPDATRRLFPVPCVQLHTTQQAQLACFSPKGNAAKR